MSTKHTSKHAPSFDTAVAFLECRGREAGIKDFELDKAFTYSDTELNDVDGSIEEHVFFTHTPSQRTICVVVDGHDEVDEVWVVNKYGEWIDEGTFASDIRKDPKAWFDKALEKKRYSASVTVSFSMDVEVDAYDDDDEAKELAREEAARTYQTADIYGIDTNVDSIDVG